MKPYLVEVGGNGSNQHKKKDAIRTNVPIAEGKANSSNGLITPEEPKTLTQSDLAEATGVSVTTVKRVLSNADKPKVEEDNNPVVRPTGVIGLRKIDRHISRKLSRFWLNMAVISIKKRVSLRLHAPIQ